MTLTGFVRALVGMINLQRNCTSTIILAPKMAVRNPLVPLSPSLCGQSPGRAGGRAHLRGASLRLASESRPRCCDAAARIALLRPSSTSLVPRQGFTVRPQDPSDERARHPSGIPRLDGLGLSSQARSQRKASALDKRSSGEAAGKHVRRCVVSSVRLSPFCCPC